MMLWAIWWNRFCRTEGDALLTRVVRGFCGSGGQGE